MGVKKVVRFLTPPPGATAARVLVLQHHAGGVVGDDPADDVRRHNDAKRRSVVSNDEGNVRPDRFDLPRVVVDDLIVRAIIRSTLAASMLP
jgi:hypothetical protein